MLLSLREMHHVDTLRLQTIEYICLKQTNDGSRSSDLYCNDIEYTRSRHVRVESITTKILSQKKLERSFSHAEHRPPWCQKWGPVRSREYEYFRLRSQPKAHWRFACSYFAVIGNSAWSFRGNIFYSGTTLVWRYRSRKCAEMERSVETWIACMLVYLNGE